MKLHPSTLLLLVSLLLPTLYGLSYDPKTGAGISDPHDPQFRLEQNHYLDFPVMRKDFQTWETVGAAVILMNKTVLAPESRDKKGIIYSKLPNKLVKNWMIDVEVSIGNDKRTSRGGTGLVLYYLKNVDQVSHRESIFGYTNGFEGLGIYINTVLKSEGRGTNKNEILNAIQGFTNDGTRPINVFTEKRHICWKHIRNLPEGQTLHLRVQYTSPLVTVSVFDIYTQKYDFCYSFEAPDLDYEGYFLLSASSGVHNPDHVYLHSVKLYDPTQQAQNEHFKEARHTKAMHEQEVQAKIQEGVKDLFEKHSQQDLGVKGDKRNMTELFKIIPKQHNQLTHKLNEVFTETSGNNDRFFETMRGLPQYVAYKSLNEKLFTFRMNLDKLNQGLDKELKSLNLYEKQLKQVRYTNNIQKGLVQREVNNPSTKYLQSNLQDLDRKMELLGQGFRDYQQAIENLSVKIRSEADFTKRLEEQRRKFANEMSGQLIYDMNEIDDIFNQMESEVISTGFGVSSMILNIGMVSVIAFSGFLWCKMRNFETKNE